MALQDFDSRVALCMTTITRRILLAGFVGFGLAIAGCGGGDEGGGESSETPQTTSNSSDSTTSADMAMNDPSMMNGGPDMGGPSMQDSMMSETDDGTGEEFVDAGFDNTASGHTEEVGGPSDPSTDSALMAAHMEEATGGASDPSIADAQMAEAGVASVNDPRLSDPSLNDPSLGNSAQGAQMAAADAAHGEPGAGSDSGEFGPDSGSPGPGGPGSNGAGAAKEPPVDSPDYPAFKIVMGLMEGKHDGLKEFVSTRGRGLTEKIRSGSLTKTEIDDLKKTFAQPRLVGTPRTIRGSRTVTLNSAGQVISLVSKKQGSNWKVSSISIKAAKKR